MTNETKDARIERLLGLLDQAAPFVEWISHSLESGIAPTYAEVMQAEIVLAKIRMEREA